MSRLARRRAASSALALGALGLASLTVGGTAQAAVTAPAGGRVTIAGTHPSWAVARNRAGRRTVTAGTVRGRVYLAARNPARLTAAAIAESTPGSPSYRHFLSPAQVQARFGQTPAQIGAVRTWLRGAGLRVTGENHHLANGYVAVSGSMAAASRAFGVRFARYRMPGQGVVRAPEQAATVPTRVAASVLGISGLSTAVQRMRPMIADLPKLPPPGPNFWTAKPCNAWYDQQIAVSKPPAYGRHWPWAVCGYQPRQLRPV
jgi:subtilase family serine protease